MNAVDATVSAADVSGYLASKGWERDGEWRGASIWHLGETARLLIPDLRDFDDTDQLIREAVAKIAGYEARPERDVWQDIAEPSVDAQYYRLHPDAPSGSIPLPAGVKAAASILEILRVTAIATEQGTRMRIEGRRTSTVDTFLHRVLLGSAAPGSYILTARMPAGSVGNGQLDLFDSPREFSGRAVAAQLRTALDAARNAAEQTLSGRGALDPFYDAVESGVSGNLCKALSDLGGEGRDQPFEIGFSWARAVPGQETAPEISFTSDMPRVLARAADELTALARSGTAQISGPITHLRDEPNEPSRIKVRGVVQLPGQPKFPRGSLWVILTGPQYQEAIEAHRLGRHVEAQGRLTTTRRRLELQPNSFRVLG
jgi:hypothetical protein